MNQPALQPYLSVRNAAAAIDFYIDVFGMTELYRLPMGDSLGHAELEYRGQRLLLADEFPQMGIVGPESRGGTTVSLLLHVDDVDALVDKAIAAGCTQERETKDEFFGARVAVIVDPFGHRWFLHQQTEDLAPEEIKARFQKIMSEHGG